MTIHLTEPDACVRYCIDQLGPRLVLATPLALGKPNHLLNAFYAQAKARSDLTLVLFTALSLDPPTPGKGLQRRFLEPFLRRHFGDYPRLDYVADLAAGTVPDNVTLSEFYFQSGSRLRNRHAQRHYVSSNYTHVARDMETRGVNVLVQMVGVDPDRPSRFSLGSNPDLTLELVERLKGRDLIRIAQVNPDMPYMEGDAEVRESFFDLVLNGCDQPLFGVPRMPVSDADFLIGLYASALIRDGGTLQLGIGSLGDAVAFFTAMRHTDNARYRELLDAAEARQRIDPELLNQWGGTEPFEQGLYAASEMFMDGFLHLYDHGVLRRRVYDHPGLQRMVNAGALGDELPPDALDRIWRAGLLPTRLDRETLGWLQRFGVLDPGVSLENDEIHCADGAAIDNRLDDERNRAVLGEHALGQALKDGALLHAAFFLGSKWLYERLNAMSPAERRQFRMTRVSRINQLYRGEDMDRAQRLEARCINTTMKLTLLGAAVSDQLADGQVVSGVGGQYNFVAMAHALDRSRSLLMLRGSRGEGRRARSNVVWEYPHATIPRHLRDLFVTEYGVADLRGASDEETIQRVLCITDSRWQESLRRKAVAEGKLRPDWRIPAAFRNNTPARASRMLAGFRSSGVLSDYPLGCDFTPEEARLAEALVYLKARQGGWLSKLRLIATAFGPAGRARDEDIPFLQRMGFTENDTDGDALLRRLLCLALHRTAPDTPTPNQ